MNIAVIGIGYVGAVTAACLCETGHSVIAVDNNKNKVLSLQEGRSPIVETGLNELIQKHHASQQLKATENLNQALHASDIFLICVGTPSNENGGLDLRYVEEVCKEIGLFLKQTNKFYTVVLRSTMLPGSAMNICLPILENFSEKKAGIDFGFGNNPEFLREGSAIYDYFNPPKIVVGANDRKSAETILSLYNGIDAPRIKTQIHVAEGVKYADNAWHATKVGFANELGNILAEVGVDSHEVMKIFCQDRKLNISEAYLKPGFAFGGSCLPKDVRAIKALGEQKGLDTPLFNSLLTANDNQITRAFNKIKTSNAKNIVMLGLSFKAGTDDTRESPLVTLAEKLITHGLNVTIYDPNIKNLQNIGSTILNPGHLISDNQNINKSADLYVIGNGNKDFLQIINSLENPKSIILDLVRLSPDIETKEGYRGICW